MLKIQRCTTGINYILKYNQIYELFLIVIIFHNIDFSLLYFNQIDAALWELNKS